MNYNKLGKGKKGYIDSYVHSRTETTSTESKQPVRQDPQPTASRTQPERHYCNAASLVGLVCLLFEDSMTLTPTLYTLRHLVMQPWC